MERVTGIGGVFFKVKDTDKTRQWYRDHLGFNIDQYGTNFEWRQADEGTLKGFTQWSPFKEDSDYFEQEFMINYRVTDLIDGDGSKVELWEPNDEAYDQMLGEGRTK
ncbi:MAG: VOC family protein [Proteobacteria bacterium]|nr:VOC family protein [Pseudomonadota bacterium]